MLVKLLPDRTSVRFTRFRLAAFVFSCAMIAASAAALWVKGLNLGVDFRGGITIEVSDTEPVDVARVRAAVQALDLGDVKVQEIRDFAAGHSAVMVFVERQQAGASGDDGTPAASAHAAAARPDGVSVAAGTQGMVTLEKSQQHAALLVQGALASVLGDGISFRKIDIVGPTVSGELIRKGALAVFFAIAAMLVYIWFRFEWQFSLGAIVALVHDVIITMGMFAVTGFEFNLAIIAAILTIVGYSMNDTVVVYDRVRENLRKFKKRPLADILDMSVNDTLSRTVMTSVTTLLALGALYLIGGEVLRGFTFAMIWGVVIGTYSSVFVASPFLLLTGVKRTGPEDPDGAQA